MSVTPLDQAPWVSAAAGGIGFALRRPLGAIAKLVGGPNELKAKHKRDAVAATSGDADPDKKCLARRRDAV